MWVGSWGETFKGKAEKLSQCLCFIKKTGGGKKTVRRPHGGLPGAQKQTAWSPSLLVKLQMHFSTVSMRGNLLFTADAASAVSVAGLQLQEHTAMS